MNTPDCRSNERLPGARRRSRRLALASALYVLGWSGAAAAYHTDDDHITDDTTGFTGTLQSANLNSLRFNAAGGSDVNMSQGSVLSIASGGILVTSNVASGTPSIANGTLAAGVTELIVTQDSAQTFGS